MFDLVFSITYPLHVFFPLQLYQLSSYQHHPVSNGKEWNKINNELKYIWTNILSVGAFPLKYQKLTKREKNIPNTIINVFLCGKIVLLLWYKGIARIPEVSAFF